MPLKFADGYRAIAWVHARYRLGAERERFSSLVYPHLKNAGIDGYVGISFGKFSRVIDFYCSSSRTAAYHLGKIQQKISEENIDCSFSITYCKPFLTKNKTNVLVEDTVSAYTFFRPENQIPYDSCLLICKELTQQSDKVSVEGYWNNSMYPLMVITRGASYFDVSNAIRSLRKQCNWAVDSNTYFALKVNSNNMNPKEDEKKGKVDAVIFGKLASLSDLKIAVYRIDDVALPIFPKPFERFGWFDFCDSLSFPSLFDLYNYSRDLKEKSQNRIIFISSILLKET